MVEKHMQLIFIVVSFIIGMIYGMFLHTTETNKQLIIISDHVGKYVVDTQKKDVYISNVYDKATTGFVVELKKHKGD